MRRLVAVSMSLLAASAAVAAPTILRVADTAAGPDVDGAVDFRVIARAAVNAHAKDAGFDADATAHLDAGVVHESASSKKNGGAVVVEFAHVEGGLRVWHDAVKVLVSRKGAVRTISGQLHKVSDDVEFVIGADDAVAVAVNSVVHAGVVASDVVVGAKDGAGYTKATLTTTRTQRSTPKLKTLRVQKILAPVRGSDIVVGAYVVEFSGVNFAYSVVVNAADGSVVATDDLVKDAAFAYRVYADADAVGRPTDGPIGDTMPYPAEAPDGHYPGFAPANLVTIDGFNAPADPWLADDASETVGNNVNAAVDTNIDGVGDFTAGLSSPGTFDYQHDISIDALANDTQRQAAATTLFYMVNWLHDWFYDSGFDEAGRNAQNDNFGRGGVGGDRVNAIAQYGAPDVRDNSAMAVLDEGESPEMEMFIWTGRQTAAITVDGVAKQASVAEFGRTAFSVSGEAVVVNDGAAPVTDACEDIVTDLAGKIAVIDRGTCSFSAKVLAADDAGAVGVIIVNDNANEGVFFMPTDPEVEQSNVPVLSMSLQDGAALKTAIGAGVVVVDLDRVQEPDRDGAFDTSVAAHEWGHYLHIRSVFCGNPQCGAQGEGWGDFIALLTLVREGDDVTGGAFPVGAFAVGAFPDDPAYFGIRRYPYSASFDKNPLTFRHIADGNRLPGTAPVAFFNAQVNNAEVHAAGEVWSAMLFQAFSALLDESAQPGATRAFEDTRRYMTDVVVQGMQLAPQDPTFTDMRDALLAAASGFDADSGRTDALTIARAFALRGAGTCAVSPERYDDVYDAVAEDFDVSGNVEVVSIDVDVTAASGVTSCDDDATLDAGETGNVTIVVSNRSPLPSPAATVTLTSTTDVTFGTVSFETGALAAFESKTLTTTATLSTTAPKKKHTTITAAVTAGSACDEDGLTIAPLTNADDVDSGLVVDSVEGSATQMGLAGRFAEFIWFIAPSDEIAVPGADWGAGNHYWFGADAPLGTDTAMNTPELRVSDSEDFVLHMRQRYSFEFDNQLNYDGAVIEISNDGGDSFSDIGDFADAGYNGVIGAEGNQQNSLDGRDGYVAQNDGYPDLEERVINFGDQFAGDRVIVRFRIGTDNGAGADGWELDDIGFDGLDNAPFPGVINNVDVCDGVDPGEGEGEGFEGEGEAAGSDLQLSGGGCHCGATSPANALGQAGAGFFALLLLRRRRRRQA